MNETIRTCQTSWLKYQYEYSIEYVCVKHKQYEVWHYLYIIATPITVSSTAESQRIIHLIMVELKTVKLVQAMGGLFTIVKCLNYPLNNGWTKNSKASAGHGWVIYNCQMSGNILDYDIQYSNDSLYQLSVSELTYS